MCLVVVCMEGGFKSSQFLIMQTKNHSLLYMVNDVSHCND